jgi:pimeloyl-ACP methyl ester carboxylesterase
MSVMLRASRVPRALLRAAGVRRGLAGAATAQGGSALTAGWVDTPRGPLELLSSSSSSPEGERPVLLLHGGFHAASCWHRVQPELGRTAPCYALSLRGHGASWRPSPRDLLLADVHAMADDLCAAAAAVAARHGGRAPVVVGHSAGGGVAQAAAARAGAQVHGLVLLASFPPAGAWRVFANWARVDPWMFLRSAAHGFHPRSPLSTPALVKRAFFSADADDAHVRQVAQELLEPTDSMAWPLSMTLRRFVDPAAVRARLGDGRVAVVGGERDVLMDSGVVHRTAAAYGIPPGDARLAIVPGVAHDAMLEAGWRRTAEQLRASVAIVAQ